MDAVWEKMADAMVESTENPEFSDWEAMQSFMISFADFLESQVVTVDNVNLYLNAVAAHSRIQKQLARKGMTRPSPGERDVERLQLKRTTAPTDDEMEEIKQWAFDARTALGDSRIASGNLNDPEPGDLFQGAETMEDAIDSIARAISDSGSWAPEIADGMFMSEPTPDLTELNAALEAIDQQQSAPTPQQADIRAELKEWGRL